MQPVSRDEVKTLLFVSVRDILHADATGDWGKFNRQQSCDKKVGAANITRSISAWRRAGFIVLLHLICFEIEHLTETIVVLLDFIGAVR